MKSAVLIPILVTLAVTGCNEGSSYNLASVSGVVTLDGKPVPGAIVNFQPQSTGQTGSGPGSTAHCDASGRYELKTIRGEPGAVIAGHVVTIYPNADRSTAGRGKDSDGGARAIVGPDIPRKYNYDTTLTFEVPAGGTASADFNLTSDP